MKVISSSILWSFWVCTKLIQVFQVRWKNSKFRKWNLLKKFGATFQSILINFWNKADFMQQNSHFPFHFKKSGALKVFWKRIWTRYFVATFRGYREEVAWDVELRRVKILNKFTQLRIYKRQGNYSQINVGVKNFWRPIWKWSWFSAIIYGDFRAVQRWKFFYSDYPEFHREHVGKFW